MLEGKSLAYIIVEYFQGLTLEEYIQANKPLNGIEQLKDLISRKYCEKNS